MFLDNRYHQFLNSVLSREKESSWRAWKICAPAMCNQDISNSLTK